MEIVISEAERMGVKLLRMESQLQAQGFYEKSGFAVCSDVFEEAGIPHVKMEKPLTLNL
jgi:predicted GNAT family N-acyltransferase